jgi:hypothetical protein
MLADLKAFYAKLEAAGEQAARDALAQGAYGNEKRPVVEEWLRQKAADRNDAATGRVASREEKRIDLAQEANDIARSSARIARAAHRISVLSIFVALVAALIAALAYLAKA